MTVRPFEAADLPGAARALIEVYETDGYPVEGVDDPEAWLRSEHVSAAWVAETGGDVVGHVAIMRPQGEDAVSLWAGQNGEDGEDGEDREDREDRENEVDARVAVLARLFVIDAARGRATGRRLVEAAMDHARAHGLRLVLDVMAKDAAAIRLYERLGWRRTGECTHHFGAGRSTPALCFVAPEG
ncbi:GNAT family N-acetyltransferase [Streptomyces sp. A012304]|uniref:GNAT family N-acetyltransferase n=1 Tax=Streptomyces sp. A012304 TaxID=375446 RepID=UPI002852B384|nr:GNAT family N-acetyltransferase [Streptomyces sp. A012304]